PRKGLRFVLGVRSRREDDAGSTPKDRDHNRVAAARGLYADGPENRDWYGTRVGRVWHSDQPDRERRGRWHRRDRCTARARGSAHDRGDRDRFRDRAGRGGATGETARVRASSHARFGPGAAEDPTPDMW